MYVFVLSPPTQTLSSAAPVTTWFAVTATPSLLMMNPEPRPAVLSSWPCSGSTKDPSASIWIVAMRTSSIVPSGDGDGNGDGDGAAEGRADAAAEGRADGAAAEGRADGAGDAAPEHAPATMAIAATAPSHRADASLDVAMGSTSLGPVPRRARRASPHVHGPGAQLPCSTVRGRPPPR